MTNQALIAETQYGNIDNKQIAFRKIGAGTPIILANRFRGTLDTWDPLFLDLLAEKNTVVTFDYPGIGYSEGELPLNLHEVAAVVVKMADYLNFDKFIAGGWSYGGLIAQYVTFLFPDRVAGTIAIGTNPMGENKTALSPLFLEKALQPEYDLEDIITLFYEPTSENSRKAAQESAIRIGQRYDNSKVPTSPEILQRYFAVTEQLAQDADNFREAYKTLQTPVLAISGDNDISFAVENWFPLLKNAPTLHHIVFPDAGHAPHYQYPELATSYINTFISSLKEQTK